MKNLLDNDRKLIESVIVLVDEARKRVAVFVNFELTMLYWDIGKKIS